MPIMPALCEFHNGLEKLRTLAVQHHPAIMCAEAVWWRCHRRIIADDLLAAGADVRHILNHGKIEPAHMTELAVSHRTVGLSTRRTPDSRNYHQVQHFAQPRIFRGFQPFKQHHFGGGQPPAPSPRLSRDGSGQTLAGAVRPVDWIPNIGIIQLCLGDSSISSAAGRTCCEDHVVTPAERNQVVPGNLDDAALITALPVVHLADCLALCAEAGSRARLIAAIPSVLQALCGRFKSRPRSLNWIAKLSQH